MGIKHPLQLGLVRTLVAVGVFSLSVQMDP